MGIHNIQDTKSPIHSTTSAPPVKATTERKGQVGARVLTWTNLPARESRIRKYQSHLDAERHEFSHQRNPSSSAFTHSWATTSSSSLRSQGSISGQSQPALTTGKTSNVGSLEAPKSETHASTEITGSLSNFRLEDSETCQFHFSQAPESSETPPYRFTRPSVGQTEQAQAQEPAAINPKTHPAQNVSNEWSWYQQSTDIHCTILQQQPQPQPGDEWVQQDVPAPIWPFPQHLPADWSPEDEAAAQAAAFELACAQQAAEEAAREEQQWEQEEREHHARTTARIWKWVEGVERDAGADAELLMVEAHRLSLRAEDGDEDENGDGMGEVTEECMLPVSDDYTEVLMERGLREDGDEILVGDDRKVWWCRCHDMTLRTFHSEGAGQVEEEEEVDWGNGEVVEDYVESAEDFNQDEFEEDQVGLEEDRTASEEDYSQKQEEMEMQAHCSDSFATSGHTARHLHAKKRTGRKYPICPDCDKAFFRKDNKEQQECWGMETFWDQF